MISSWMTRWSEFSWRWPLRCNYLQRDKRWVMRKVQLANQRSGSTPGNAVLLQHLLSLKWDKQLLHLRQLLVFWSGQCAHSSDGLRRIHLHQERAFCAQRPLYCEYLWRNSGVYLWEEMKGWKMATGRIKPGSRWSALSSCSCCCFIQSASLGV